MVRKSRSGFVRFIDFRTMPRVKKLKDLVLEVKYEELEQYDNFWNDELIQKKENKYAFVIGAFLISFSALEHDLNVGIAEVINERSHDDGYLITQDLEMGQKIELFHNLYFPRVYYSDKNKVKKMKELVLIKNSLEEVNRLRNKVAHAQWHTLDKGGYVRVDTKTSKENGLIKFRMFKITPMIMRKGIKNCEVLSERIFEFKENLWS